MFPAVCNYDYPDYPFILLRLTLLFFRLWLQQFSGLLSKNHDENPHMRKIFNSKSPPKGHTCTDSRRDFWTTNLKTAVCHTALY